MEHHVLVNWIAIAVAVCAVLRGLYLTFDDEIRDWWEERQYQKQQHQTPPEDPEKKEDDNAT